MPESPSVHMEADDGMGTFRALAERRIAAAKAIDQALVELERAFTEMDAANRAFADALIEFNRSTSQVMGFVARTPMFAIGAAAALAPKACAGLGVRLPVRTSRVPMAEVAPRWIDREVFELEAERSHA